MATVIRLKQMRAVVLVVLMCFAAFFIFSFNSWAGNHVLTSFSSTPISSGEISEKDAVDKARAEFSGDVLSVKAQMLSDKPVFRIQIISSSGRVKVLNISRKSGDVIH